MMTREEAINELQMAIDLIKQNGKDWLDERDIPILQMAITALELSDSIMLQLDCKMFHSGVNVDNIVSDETTDIIYRQAAINAMINSRSNADVTLVPGSYTNGWRDGRKLLLDELLQVVFELPSAQPVDKDIHVPCNDTISRQAAIDTEGLDVQIRCEMCRNPMHTDRGCDGNCKYDEKLYERIMQILGERIKPLPSAQPDVPDTNVGDMISRQALLDMLHRECSTLVENFMKKKVNALPSVQPEPLTDKEQRIFLSAMAREEKVCKEVDGNLVREPYEDSLVKICRGITRKVKGALWT